MYTFAEIIFNLVSSWKKKCKYTVPDGLLYKSLCEGLHPVMLNMYKYMGVNN